MKLRSDRVTKGVEQAPHRSLFYAMGYTKEELDRPLIGISIRLRKRLKREYVWREEHRF